MNEHWKPDAPWVFLNHTADIRMEARGKTMEELFAHAAEGLTSLVSRESRGNPQIEVDIALEGDDYEQLLVDWLRELLFLNQTRGFVLTCPNISKLTETRLEARIAGRSARSDEEQPDLEIKAVTYHGLSIRKEDAGYSVRIVFDV